MTSSLNAQALHKAPGGRSEKQAAQRAAAAAVASEIGRWVNTAERGEVFTYGYAGEDCCPSSDAMRAASKLAAGGFIALVQKRLDDGRIAYQAQRTWRKQEEKPAPPKPKLIHFVSRPRVAKPKEAVAGERRCAFPGCVNAVCRTNVSTVCMQHTHHAPYCQCGRCTRPR